MLLSRAADRHHHEDHHHRQDLREDPMQKRVRRKLRDLFVSSPPLEDEEKRGDDDESGLLPATESSGGGGRVGWHLGEVEQAAAAGAQHRSRPRSTTGSTQAMTRLPNGSHPFTGHPSPRRKTSDSDVTRQHGREETLSSRAVEAASGGGAAWRRWCDGRPAAGRSVSASPSRRGRWRCVEAASCDDM
ncbi:hypothetical protein Tsubulata_012177 [Turnera subulata]|uniref:Uncharacterized protein n=1 Tax=Turnera subulata TaxID=218843 RepID=A0A9Q0JN76_9ROSI|nr:hypothetical protein Tsubulata_012177 [Turnera subulata]